MHLNFLFNCLFLQAKKLQKEGSLIQAFYCDVPYKTLQ